MREEGNERRVERARVARDWPGGPAPAMISSRDPGMASANSRDSSTGVSSSSAPTTISAGTRRAATMLVESGRSIMRTMAPRIRVGRLLLDQPPHGRLHRGVARARSSGRPAVGIISRATPEAPSRSTIASMRSTFVARSACPPAARVSARTTPLTRCGASRIVAKVAYPPIEQPPITACSHLQLGEQVDHVLRVVVHRRRLAVRIVVPPNPRRSGVIRRHPPGDAADLRLPHVRAQRKRVQQHEHAPGRIPFLEIRNASGAEHDGVSHHAALYR